MKISPCGAVGEVTGSGYLIETRSARVLVDFGMFQGGRDTEEKNRDLGPVDPLSLDAVVLTHAHLDHCGRLPLLPAHGFRAAIHATPATIDFADLILTDSAHIQEMDAYRMNRRHRRAGQPVEVPLYTQTEVGAVRPLFSALPYGEAREIASGVSVRLIDAGHILGSASVEATIEEGGERKVVVFSGDIGPKNAPILRDPTAPVEADLLFMESTYGDREHRSLDETVAQFKAILKAAVDEGRRVLIPSFAVGRTQQILFHLAELVRSGEVADFPIHLDSPMAIRATRLYEKHRNLFDEETTGLLKSGRYREDLKNLTFCETADESRALNEEWDASVIVAASGMCDGGRIMHHLKHNLWRENVDVMIVGFQVNGSLGRRLVDGAKTVHMFGEEIVVRARIHTLGGFSAHAGRTELLQWYSTPSPRAPRVALTHGEDRAREALAKTLREKHGATVLTPGPGDAIEV